MNQKTKTYVGIVAVFAMLFVAVVAANVQQAKAEEEENRDQLICRVNEIEDNERNFEQIRLTNAQIKEEKRIAAEKAEQERIAKEEEEKKKQEEQAYLESLKQQQQTVSYSSQPNGKLTKTGGVNYFEGSKETWYSSRQLYHRNTSQWTAGSDGVYRDKDGYVVVARSDRSQGSTINTSYGPGKVYDSGCANGVTDIYTNW